MTDKQTLLALAERVEKAEGADRELDCLVWCRVKGITAEWQGNLLVAGEEGVIGYIDPGEHQRNFSCNRADQGWAGIRAYTASLDAAMTLIDPADEWSLTTIYNIARAEVGINRDQQTAWTGYGENACCIPVLALLAAALRARAGAML